MPIEPLRMKGDDVQLVRAMEPSTRVDRYRKAFLSAALPGLWLDARGRVVEVNAAACELLDESLRRRVGRPAISMIHPEDRHDIVQFIIDANSSQEGTIRREVRLVADGHARNVVLGLAYIATPENPGFYLQIHDVTDLRNTEAALDETERSFRRFFADHTVAMFRSRPNGEIVDANQAMAELAGYPHPKYLLSINAEKLYVRPSDREAITADLARTGSLAGRDFELARLDGAPIWARFFARVVPAADGSLVYEGALFDVTERYVAEAQIRARELKQASVSALGQLALQSNDAHAVALSAARIAQEVLGMDAVALLRGQPLKAFARWDDPALVGTLLDELDPNWLLSQIPESGDGAVVAAPDGGTVGVVPLPDIDDGVALLAAATGGTFEAPDEDLLFLQSIAGVVAATLERTASRRRLEELVSSKDEFIASISHEVRTPLTVVLGVALELQERWSEVDPSARDDLLDLLVGQTQEMSDLVEDLLVAARADIGKLPIHVEPMAVTSVIADVVAAMRVPAGVELSMTDQNPVCFADPVRFRQIIRNLLTNAFRYGGDRIHVTVSHDEHRVWVDVADNGEGVAPEDREVIFQAYERAHRSLGRTASVGLGLTVSRRLARLMDGDLTYRFDGNSVFTLELMAASPANTFTERSGAVADA